MTSSSTQRKLSWRTLPSIEIDVGRDTSLGMATFSEATVDCSFLRGRSKWGAINNPPSQDVGLLYLKIFFYQPRDCRLRYIKAETEVRPETKTTSGQTPYIHVAYPGQVCGQPWEESVEKMKEFRPHGEGAGFGGDIGGVSQHTNLKRQYRWSFTLQKHADERGEYTKLAWRWEAQEKGASVAFERPIYAAMVVGHEKSPFKIRTRITGRFESSRYGWRNLMIGRAEGREVSLTPGSSTTPTDLTIEIGELEQAIEAVNQRQALTELSDYKQVV